MERISAVFCLLFVVTLAISNLTIVEPAFAQSIPTPSVPQFTIETINSPYDVPPTTTTSTNPYTNQTTTTTIPGYHVENKTTEIKIKNQPFTPYQIQENGVNWTVNLFYNIRMKGHFSEDWSNYKLNNGSGDGNLVQDYNAQFTVVRIDDYLPTEGQIDFQVQALEGYQHGFEPVPGAPGEFWIITGSASDWSNTQTLAIPATLLSPTPTVSPTIPELSWLAILPFFVSMLFMAAKLRNRKTNSASQLL
jgi:hypothetical protein